MFIEQLFEILDEYAPIKFSHKCIEKGEYDNSGILIKTHDEVKSVLFSLDLSMQSVNKAKELNCDTIITHHPAIYNPIKSMDFCDGNKEILLATRLGLNVISMHLNLDYSKFGIDQGLANVLGAKSVEIFDDFGDGNGYGRQFLIEEIPFFDFIGDLKNKLSSQKIWGFGDNKKIKKVACFCGAGHSFAMDALRQKFLSADVIVSADIPHHVIKEFLENNINVVQLTHYVSEVVGFNDYYELIKGKISKEIETFFYDDKRFR